MSKKHILAATIATVLSTGLVAGTMSQVFASDHSGNARKMATEPAMGMKQDDTKADQEMVKVSEDAMLSMRDVHSARLAIFNGQTELARTSVDAAVTRINAAVREGEQYALDVKDPKSEDWYVPFDASFTVMDVFEPTNTNTKAQDQDHIAKANQHLNKGEQKQAMEELKLGETDTAVSAGLVPVKFAQEQIAEAARLVSDGKYYEANLALKSVDDAVIVQTFAIDEMAQVQGDSSTGSKG
jgi:cellobiose-specific phosphotransferase system component IIA